MNVPIADRNFCNSVVLLMEIDRLARSTLYFSAIVVTCSSFPLLLCVIIPQLRVIYQCPSLRRVAFLFLFFFFFFSKSHILEDTMKIVNSLKLVECDIIFYFVNINVENLHVIAIIKFSRQIFSFLWIRTHVNDSDVKLAMKRIKN